ncbi:MAG: RNA polymerase sigma-70 factor [Bacteroidales bacterium]|nr:RNA polymerase sigma-70 factor [Bacteroidales bacterium]
MSGNISRVDFTSDELFFRGLYKEYYHKAVYYANQYLNDYEASKEIVQEAFLSLWERRDVLEFNQNIGAYLIKTVKNKSLNELRDNIRKLQNVNSEKQADLILNQRSLLDDSSSLVENKELSLQIKRILDNMPLKMREVFLMNRDMELTYPQIAANQGVSVKTVEYRISRALAIFRKNLSEWM